MIRDVIEAHTLGVDRIGPFLVTAMIPDMAAGYVAIYGNARGPNYATVSACSSSNHAIGDALGLIRRGDADVMIAGGAEAGIGEIPVGAFAAMRALSTKRNDEPQRGLAPVRRGPRRLRHGRWCRHPGARGARARAGARRADPRRGGRLRGDRRRVAHHPPGPRWPRRRRQHAPGACATPACHRRRRLHQRPWHQHAAERSLGDGRHQDRLRRARLRRSRSAAPRA